MADTPTPAAIQPTEPPRSIWLFLIFTLVIAGAVLVFLRVFVGVAIDAPTLGLAVACAALIGALRGMWGVVFALTRPTVETIVAESTIGPAALGSKAELREEKQRVLRAIKELEFDHAMGKLSDDDFKQVSDGYRLRAIEVMRALDEDGGELHPVLREHLAGLGHDLRSETAATTETETETAAESSPVESSEEAAS